MFMNVQLNFDQTKETRYFQLLQMISYYLLLIYADVREWFDILLFTCVIKCIL